MGRICTPNVGSTYTGNAIGARCKSCIRVHVCMCTHVRERWGRVRERVQLGWTGGCAGEQWGTRWGKTGPQLMQDFGEKTSFSNYFMNMWNREAVPLEKGDLWGTVNCNCFQLSRMMRECPFVWTLSFNSWKALEKAESKVHHQPHNQALSLKTFLRANFSTVFA